MSVFRPLCKTLAPGLSHTRMSRLSRHDSSSRDQLREMNATVSIFFQAHRETKAAAHYRTHMD